MPGAKIRHEHARVHFQFRSRGGRTHDAQRQPDTHRQGVFEKALYNCKAAGGAVRNDEILPKKKV